MLPALTNQFHRKLVGNNRTTGLARPPMQAGQGKWSVRGWPLAATSTGRGGEDNVPGLDVKVMGESHARGVEVTGQEADIYRGGRCQPQTDTGRKE